MRAHRSNVTILGNLTTDTHGVDDTDQVVVVTAIPVEANVDAVVKETDFSTEVQLVLFLVGQLRVLEVGNLKCRLVHAGKRTPGVHTLDNHARVTDAGRTTVTGQRIRGLQSQVRYCRTQRLEPRLLVCVPGT